MDLGEVPQYQCGEISIAAISGTAARALDGKIYIALVNADPVNSHPVTVRLAGESVCRASGELLTGSEMDSHNTFDNPEQIAPVEYSASASDGELQLELPAKSILVVSLG